MKTNLQIQLANIISRFNSSRIYFGILFLSFFLWSSLGLGQIALRGTPTTASINSSSAVTTITLNKPTGVVSGDVMIVAITNYTNGTTYTSASLTGWTLIDGRSLNTSFPKSYGTILYKIATASEPSSYSFTIAGSKYAAATITAFSGVDVNGGTGLNGTGSGPFDATIGTINRGTSTLTASAITTSNTNSAIIMYGFVGLYDYTYSGWAATSPSSLSEIAEVISGADYASVGAAWATKSTAGATGTGSTTISGISGYSGGILLALKQPACSTPTSLAASVSSSSQTTSSISGSFTAAVTPPNGYVVVRTTTNSQPSLTNGTTYTVGSNSIGYIEYVGSGAGSWTSNNLSGGTTYYYWVFSYNNSSCSGAPVYSTSATTFSQSTVICPGTSLAGLTYSSNPANYCLNSAITTNTPTFSSSAPTITYSVSPSLPTGLSINSTTGAITGTPTAAVAAANYTITADNGCTNTSASVSIATLTLPASPTASAATSVLPFSFTANWSAVTGATSYILDVATDNTYTNLVTGFNALNVNNVTSYSVTGLNAATTYYYRVRSTNGTCNSANSSTITVSTPAVTSIASGNWNATTTWNSGTVPTCGDIITIASTHTVTVNSSSNISKNLTINSGGTLVIASGDLTVGCTLNNTPLTNNGILTVNGGVLNVNGNLVCNSGATFNQSGGDINIDGNNGGTAATSSSTALLSLNTALGTVNGGTITIIDPPATSAATKTISYSVSTTSITWTPPHTLKLGDGISTTIGGNANGFELDCYVSTGRLVLGNVIVNGGNGNNRWTSSSSSTSNGTWLNNLTINSGSEFRDGSATYTYILGNITNNGILTNQSAILRLAGWNTSSNVEIANANSQTISGSGTFRNATSSSTANLSSLTINNSNATGVTLSVPLSLSGTLTMTAGKINTTATNLLTLGTTSAAGTLSYSGGQISGPFARTFALSRTAAGTYDATTLFPVGDGTNYIPIHIDPSTTSGGAVVMSGQIYNTNTGSSNFCTLSSNRWEALPIIGSANLSNCFIGIYDANIVNSSSSIIVQSNSASGTYNSITPNSTYVAAVAPLPKGLRTATSISNSAFNGYFAFASQNRWSGAVSTDWNNSGNWSCASVPGGSDNVVIPTTGITNYPSLSGATAIKDLNIGSGTLSLNGKIFTINGTVSGSGTISGSTSSSIIIGTNVSAGTIKFTPASNSLKNLTLNSGSSATLGNALNIATGATPGVLTINSGATLTTGGYLTMKSDATGTAQVANSSGSVSGEVTVERYIPANSNRAWRTLAAPTYSASQTIANSWQLGTLITGPGGGNGLDQSTGGYSMMTYDPTTDNLNGISNTSSTILSNSSSSPAAYYLYIRGDRNTGVANTNLNATQTTLTSKGALYQGTITTSIAATNSGGTTYHLVGNPYVSPINLNSFYTANTGAIDNVFYLWDPQISNTAAGVGAIATFAASSGAYAPAVTGGSYSGNITEIPSGMAFFVKKSASSSGSIVFNESMKSSGTSITNGYNGFKTTSSIDGQLQINLNVKINDSTEKPVDGLLEIFDSNEQLQVNSSDAIKMGNFGENMSIQNQGDLLAIEKRPLFNQDTLHIHTTGLTNRPYILQFNPSSFNGFSKAYLIDNYTLSLQSIPLDKKSNYPFTIDGNLLSKGPNRFDIIFEQSTLQIKNNKALSSIELYPNPVKDGFVNISMYQQKEGFYEITILNGLGSEIQKITWNHSINEQIHTVELKNQSSGIYYLKLSNEFGDQIIKKFIQSSNNF
jgi:hypothetical protein